VIEGQKVPALLAALLGEGVLPQQIEDAVAQVRSLKLGKSISRLAGPSFDERLTRAWIFEQADRLDHR
jgi:hypothetical protein